MRDLKKNYKPSLYEKIKNNGYNYAKIIIPRLEKTFNIESVLDIGCGGASFLHGCVDLGKNVIGVDGEHVESSLQIDKVKVIYHNLEKPLVFLGRFDLCVSLEVAEHIPFEFSDVLIDSICKHSNNILFGAAQVGQPGIDHINCQPLEFWIKKFEDRGYEHIEVVSKYIRKSLKIYNWYRKNSMLFRKLG